MKVKITSVNGVLRENVETSQEISTIAELNEAIASVIQASRAWFNDVQVVKNGCVITNIYNNKQELLDYLTGVTSSFEPLKAVA